VLSAAPSKEKVNHITKINLWVKGFISQDPQDLTTEQINKLIPKISVCATYSEHWNICFIQ